MSSLRNKIASSPLRNKVAASLLIAGGIFIVYMGYLECTESNVYGIPYNLIRELIDRLLSRGSQGATLTRIGHIALEIYMKMWLLTIAAGLFSIVGGILILTGRVSRGKELAHYSEIGLGSLIYALILHYFEKELEELLSTIPGAGQIDLEIITLPYFITWAVFLSFYLARWIAKEPKPTAPKIVQTPPSPPKEPQRTIDRPTKRPTSINRPKTEGSKWFPASS